MANILIFMIALRFCNILTYYNQTHIKRSIVTKISNIKDNIETKVNYIFDELEKNKNKSNLIKFTKDKMIADDPYLSPEFNILFLIF